jgi:hypothetical protein
VPEIAKPAGRPSVNMLFEAKAVSKAKPFIGLLVYWGLCLINRVCLKIPPFAQKIILTANGERLGKRQILELKA